MTDYKTKFRMRVSGLEQCSFRDDRETSPRPHILPNPRYDLHRVYVYTKDVPIERVRSDLEEKVGLPDAMAQAYAINCMLYVLPVDIPDDMPEELRVPLKENGFDLSAVFIRGATNEYVKAKTIEVAGELLEKALKELREEYGNFNIGWSFREAHNLLDPCDILLRYDEGLAELEYLEGSGELKKLLRVTEALGRAEERGVDILEELRKRRETNPENN